MVFTLTAGEGPAVRDLGPAEELERGIGLLVQTIEGCAGVTDKARLKQSEKLCARLAADVYERSVGPLLSNRIDTGTLIVSPDGSLHRLPFGMLRTSGEPLLERYSIRYLTSPLELAATDHRETTGEYGAVLFQGPADAEAGEIIRKMKTGRPGKPGKSRGIFSYLTAFLKREDSPFAEEMRDLLPLLKKITGTEPVPYSGADATEEQFRRIRHPGILHITGHGFYRAAETEGVDKGTTRGPDPMAVSGLLLHGGEHSGVQGEDGVLTAMEISGTDLWGTRLVVLSACETGRGSVVTGEGVYGLQRAFKAAGARTLVMSLWPVPDRETRELMRFYYENLARGQPAIQALCNAERRMRRLTVERYGVDHPFFWAGFVGAGDDQPVTF